jgi:large subunit ribosomal protein L7/L12
MSEKVQSIIESIKGLSLLEASELVKGLEETFGVSAAAASVAVAAAPAAGGGGAAAPAEEKTEFNVILTAVAATRLA